ncbi:MAG TPA: hypothetical protein VGD78_20345 [Chthoniobacterales bacterium]
MQETAKKLTWKVNTRGQYVAIALDRDFVIERLKSGYWSFAYYPHGGAHRLGGRQSACLAEAKESAQTVVRACGRAAREAKSRAQRIVDFGMD